MPKATSAKSKQKSSTERKTATAKKKSSTTATKGRPKKKSKVEDVDAIELTGSEDDIKDVIEIEYVSSCSPGTYCEA
jgi:hypothetical protein